MSKRTPEHWRAYCQQKDNAARRGIGWRLTYQQWLKLWADSGHLHERGRLAHQYVLSRKGDKGNYAVNNCRVTLCSINCANNHGRKQQGPAERAKRAASIKAQWDALSPKQRQKRVENAKAAAARKRA